MSNWKEERIAECIELQKEKEIIELDRARDEELQNVERWYTEAADKLAMLKQPYTDRIAVVDASLLEAQLRLIAEWDIPEKTYKCDAGTATVRTTKSLHIQDKKGLIQTLVGIGKLPEAIRSWNLSYLRKLKDVDMISDMVATYEWQQNVVIKGVAEK